MVQNNKGTSSDTSLVTKSTPENHAVKLNIKLNKNIIRKLINKLYLCHHNNKQTDCVKQASFLYVKHI